MYIYTHIHIDISVCINCINIYIYIYFFDILIRIIKDCTILKSTVYIFIYL